MKKTLNENVFNEAIIYLENEYNSFSFDNSIRSKYLKELLTKYIRTIKCIYLLDLNGYQKECDVLIRTLDEMLIDIAYLEINPKEHYERYELYASARIYKLLKEQGIYNEEYKNKYEEYIKKYERITDRWSGLDYKTQSLKIDKYFKNPVMSFEMLYMKIYKINLLYSHNSPIILNSDYSKLNILANPDYLYFHNINYIVLLTTMLYFILPDIFKTEPLFAYSFDNFLSGLKLYNFINDQK